jgi:hypothetical protein
VVPTLKPGLPKDNSLSFYTHRTYQYDVEGNAKDGEREAHVETGTK